MPKTLFERMSEAARTNAAKAALEWWQREGLSEPCPNWREGTRRCNCKACRSRRKVAA